MSGTASLPRGWRVEVTADPESVAGDWERLAVRSRNIFGTWSWARTWLDAGDATGELAIVTARDDGGEARVVIPLVRESRAGVKLLRFVGHGPADELGPVAAADDDAAAHDVLAAALELRDLSWDVFVGERLAEGASHRWSAARVLRTESSPLVTTDDDWESYLGERSSNFRSQVRSRERKLKREHDLRFRLSDGSDDDLDLLFDLHRRRWEGDETSFVAAEPFHRSFARVARDEGWLRLWIMELDGAPVAAWYGFRFAGVESYYQAGRDPERDRESVGFVLLAHSIRSAFEDGVREYRLLRGDESYKDRFATDERRRETFAVAGSTVGRVAVRAGAALLEHAPFRRVTGAIVD